MKLENREKVMDLINKAKSLNLELFHIEKLKKSSTLEIRDRMGGYDFVNVDTIDVASVLDNLERTIREKLKSIDSQLEEL